MKGMRSNKKTMRSLRFAVKKRSRELVLHALRWKPKLKTQEGGQLLWSIIDNPEIASMLVLAGADLDVRNPIDNTSLLLCVASKVNNLQYMYLALLMLEYGANVNFRNNNGNTALHLAVKNESIPLVEALLEKGLSVDIANIDDETAISMAAKCSNAAEMLRLLIDHEPIDTGKRNRRIVNAMQVLMCSDKDEISAIKELLSLGVDINEKSDCGLTPFSFAIARGKTNLVALLLKFNPDINKLIEQSNLPTIRASYIEQTLILHLLLDEDASINECDEYGRSRLHIACACSNFLSVRNIQLLLQLGADINKIDNMGDTPFSMMNCESLNDSRQLFIKHLALLKWKGAVVTENDLILIRKDLKSHKLFKDCLDELKRMEKTMVHNGFSVYDFFLKSLHKLSSYARDSDFETSYNKKKYLFPLFFRDLENTFTVAKIRRDMLLFMEIVVRILTYGMLPSRAVELIAYYMISDKLQSLPREYYFSIYALTGVKKSFDIIA